MVWTAHTSTKKQTCLLLRNMIHKHLTETNHLHRWSLKKTWLISIWINLWPHEEKFYHSDWDMKTQHNNSATGNEPKAHITDPPVYWDQRCAAVSECFHVGSNQCAASTPHCQISAFHTPATAQNQNHGSEKAAIIFLHAYLVCKQQNLS